MKSIANQYRDLKEGKLSQFNFMRNLRMTMPQYVTNTTSFNDAVKILKSKRILNETMDIQPVPEADEDFSNDTNYDALDAADTNAEELAKAAGSYDAAVGMLQDEMGLSFSAASAIAARVYPEGGDDAETLAMIDKIEQEMAGEEAVKAQYDLPENLNEYEYAYHRINGVCYKVDDEGNRTRVSDYFCNNNESLSEAKQKIDADRVHPQELSMGIKVEMEHTKDAEKAKKIALDHLAENPFYYTQLKLSGVDVKATPSKEKKAIAKKKDETELVDKANQMKPVKGVEKAKASSNKAKKETNKPVKGISLMSLIAKTARGVQKMAATGEKMKTVKEGYEDFLAQKKSEEEAAETYNGFKKGDKVMIDPDAAKATGLKAGKIYTVTNFRIYRKGSMLQNVDALLDNGEEINVDYLIKAPKVFTSSANLGSIDLKKLTELVQEVLAEMNSNQQETDDVALGIDETFDGRDNLTDVTGENK